MYNRELSLFKEDESVDWLRIFHFSLSDFRDLISRRMVILVLTAIILYQGTGIIYNILKLQLIRTRPAPAAVERGRLAAPVREPADAYRVIPERNLFGTTHMTTDRQAGGLQQQDIALPIELRGTVAGEGKYGFAIIEEKGSRKQRLVKAGDILLSGAKVVRIKRNAVDLMINNRKQTLKIVETKEGPILTPSPVATPGVAPGTTVLSRSEIDEGLQDMGSLLRQALVRPYFNAGVPDGFLISNIRPGSLYKKMGMIDGDIIQEVNNRKIQTADDVMGLLSTIKSGSSLSVTVKRQGNQETLNYQFQ
jgi:general secretion pathway protein C